MSNAKIGPSYDDKFRSLEIKALEIQIEELEARLDKSWGIIQEKSAEIEQLRNALEDIRFSVQVGGPAATRISTVLGIIADALEDSHQ